MILKRIESNLQNAIFCRDSVGIVPLFEGVSFQDIVMCWLGKGQTDLEIHRDTIPNINSLKVGVITIVKSSAIRIEFVGELDDVSTLFLPRKSVENISELTTSSQVFPLAAVIDLAESGVSGSIRPVRMFFNSGTSPTSKHNGSPAHGETAGESNLRTNVLQMVL